MCILAVGTTVVIYDDTGSNYLLIESCSQYTGILYYVRPRNTPYCITGTHQNTSREERGDEGERGGACCAFLCLLATESLHSCFTLVVSIVQHYLLLEADSASPTVDVSVPELPNCYFPENLCRYFSRYATI